jgi:hypothetical protein
VPAALVTGFHNNAYFGALFANQLTPGNGKSKAKHSTPRGKLGGLGEANGDRVHEPIGDGAVASGRVLVAQRAREPGSRLFRRPEVQLVPLGQHRHLRACVRRNTRALLTTAVKPSLYQITAGTVKLLQHGEAACLTCLSQAHGTAAAAGKATNLLLPSQHTLLALPELACST